MPSPSCSTFPENAEFAVLVLEPHNVLNPFKHSDVPCAEICQENNDAFSYLKLITAIDSACIYIVSLLLFFNLLFLKKNNQALIQDI